MGNIFILTVDDPNGLDTRLMYPGTRSIQKGASSVNTDGSTGSISYYDAPNGIADERNFYGIKFDGNDLKLTATGDLAGFIRSAVFKINGTIAAHLDVAGFTAPMASAFGLSPNALINAFTSYGGASLQMFGNTGADTLAGSDWADILDGRINADTMIGYGGNDVYTVDDVGDRVIEAEGQGIDTVKSTISQVLAANVENLTLLGTGAVTGVGNAANNVLRGNAGQNRLTGLAGDDTYFIGAGDSVVEAANGGFDRVYTSVTHTASANVETVYLIGEANIDGTGNALANVFSGNAGRNTFRGLAGNDIYVVGAGDTVVEAADGGIDTVNFQPAAPGTFILGANIENLKLVSLALNGVNGTGNSGANTLTGSVDDNTLNGGGGADKMVGGGGNDVYVTDGGDTIMEALNAGIDTVQSSVSLTLGANVENLTLTGSAALNGAGNALANTLIGNSGVNGLAGYGGDDIYYVQTARDAVIEGADAGIDTVRSTVTFTLGANVEKLTLDGAAAINATGNALVNTILGNTGANRIEAGTGNDSMAGLAGADLFVFHAGSGTDVIADFNAFPGTEHDRIQFDRSQYADFADVMAHATTPTGPNGSLTFISEGSDTLVLYVQKALLTADDFLFV